MYTMRILEDKVAFGKSDTDIKRTIDKFHSQFQLNNDIYRDNNNFVQFNTAVVTNK
jgi:hypothetical protein|tara:strand:- start:134 stop:301 length:168 start_codon:yes stop_codon:yes gene_type:complete